MPSPRQSVACAVALAAALVAGFSCRRPASGPAPGDLPGVLSRLRQRGLELHVYAAGPGAEVGRCLFLADGPRRADELRALPRLEGALGQWRGAALAEELADSAELYLEGPGVLRYGRVLLFGDPALLARVRAALAE